MISLPIVGRNLGSRLRYYAIAAVSTYGSDRKPQTLTPGLPMG